MKPSIPPHVETISKAFSDISNVDHQLATLTMLSMQFFITRCPEENAHKAIDAFAKGLKDHIQQFYDDMKVGKTMMNMETKGNA